MEEAFAKLPKFKDILKNVVSGSFFKCTKKRKGAGHKRAYTLEPYVQETGGVYGKLNANTKVVNLSASHQPTLEVPSSHTPLFQLLSSEKLPIEMTPLERHAMHMPTEARQNLHILQVE